MNIEVSNINDIPELMKIYDLARKRMVNEGNISQWDNKKVFEKELYDYINKGELFKVVKNMEIVGYFAYIRTPENAYSIIDGKWLNNETYITIHKMASKYPKMGIGRYIINHVIDKMSKEKIKNIRIDTHKNNISMNSFLVKLGFKYCGIISLNLNFNDEYQLRNAYQYKLDN